MLRCSNIDTLASARLVVEDSLTIPDARTPAAAPLQASASQITASGWGAEVAAPAPVIAFASQRRKQPATAAPVAAAVTPTLSSRARDVSPSPAAGRSSPAASALEIARKKVIQAAAARAMSPAGDDKAGTQSLATVMPAAFRPAGYRKR